MTDRDDLPVVAFASASAFERFLEEHHEQPTGIWLKFAKLRSGVESVTYPEAVDVALCFGWIDGQKQPVDGTHYMIRFTPRRARSRWSRVNCAKVTSLAKAGRMRRAGQAEVDRARADGRWDAAYAPASTAEVPDDLRAALDANAAAAASFATLNSANRYAVLYRVNDAKRPETRQRRIQQFVDMLADGRVLHPMRKQ